MKKPTPCDIRISPYRIYYATKWYETDYLHSSNVIDTSSTVIPYESPQIDTNSSIFNSEKFRGGFEYFLYKALIIYLEIIAL